MKLPEVDINRPFFSNKVLRYIKIYSNILKEYISISKFAGVHAFIYGTYKNCFLTNLCVF